ncbi:MAG TPA: sigma-70 family RNA polymerase sigma factor [Actinomycetota bacterium]|nr:sigma-70 family RNA polymerase sigma factor [Actinomycetota bacterium]
MITGTLDDAQKAELWHLWHTEKDTVAREALICHYLPMVEFLATPFARHVPISYRNDLLSFGVIGLMDALDKFRPDLGFRFETYGSCRIRGAMSDGVRQLAWLPRGAANRASRIIEKVVPVDFQAARAADGTRLQDCLTERTEESPFDFLEIADDHSEVVQALSELPERERTVIKKYYYERQQLKEIGLSMGVTESRVCQLHRRALRQLGEVLVQRRSA